MKNMILATVGLILTASVQVAVAKPLADSTNTGAYGVAGCGLGSMVLGDKPGAMQVLAATLNGTGVQTFGITTGTSNCGKGLIAQRATDFVKSNKVALQNEAAKGEGETLASFAQMMECQNQGFAQDVKSNFESIFSLNNDSAVANALIVRCQI